ncbi:hypothetical protein IWW37_005331 [Coemansia sp. RSA 2050]|nr:hypothetical protein IWW37_005331 [Coemansia sp. RSA 2050]KAJ2730350.1 hypothetical protein IW152_005308 [Coemansia sp. BCRC 34962]
MPAWISLASVRGRAFLLIGALAVLAVVGIVAIYRLNYEYLSLSTYGSPASANGQKVRSRFESYLHRIHHQVYKEDMQTFCSQETFSEGFIASRRQRYEEIVHGGTGPVFIAINLYNSEKILPSMAQQILALADTLGHNRVFISVYENGSKDRTKDILNRFNTTLNALGIAHKIRSEAAPRPKHIHRIEYLARVRNFALEPLYNSGTKYSKVLFLNDIFFCVADILELLFQSRAQSAHLACAEDFDMYNGGPGFYDTWVTRDMRGERFTKNMHKLTKDSISMVAQMRDRPFQVQCCWNGAALIDAQVFHGDNGLRFRRSVEGECSASECSLLCNDMWAKGFRRAIVVPRVKVSYDIQTRNTLRKPASFPADMPYNMPEAEKISFRSGPEKVICLPLNGIDAHHPDAPSVYVKL